MRACNLIKALKPLEGWQVHIHFGDVDLWWQTCERVVHLPPDQRDGAQGNVLLFNGHFDATGRPCGWTMMARRVRDVYWVDEETVVIAVRDGTKGEITKLRKAQREGA